MPTGNDQIFDEKSRAEIPVDLTRSEPKWKQLLKNKTIIFSTIVAVLILGSIIWFFLFSASSANVPTSNSVVLLIKGPDQIISGNEAEYHITYHNGENADLVDVSMDLLYPSGFKFKSATPSPTSSSGQAFNLQMVKAGNDGEVVLRGKLSGSTAEDKQIKAVLHYQLSNFNSQFAVEQTLHTSILPPNLTMDINGPVEVVNGQDSTFTISFTNVTSQDFDNLALQVTYPDGFSFSSSNPPATKNNNFWKLSKLASNSSASIDISGNFTGDNSDAKLVKADLGQIVNNVFAPQLVSTATFNLIPSSLAITLTSDAKDGLVSLGDTINYKLKYANQGNIGLNNLVIIVNMEGPALDFTRLNAADAIVSGKTLTWKAATLPVLNILSPNEQGEIDFSVPVVANINTNLKNQIIKASALISANEAPKPTKAADVALKLSSEITLMVNGDYISGAAPMQVNKTTLFNMTFILSNLSNDLSNTKVTASLPLPSQDWKNIIVPEVEKNRLSYDPNSGKISWNIGDLAAFTGKFIPALKVSFQLQVKPTEVDRNKVINLLSNIQATATDAFTLKDIATENISNLSTADIDDDVLNTKGTTVQ